MYENYYGLSAKPFQLSPDPSFFFGSAGHARALAYLRYGVEHGDGFVVLTGEVGTGKTTLARILSQELTEKRDVVSAQLVMSNGGANDLLGMVAEAFGVRQEGRTRPSVLKAFETFLREQHAANKRVLLLLDEVQNLPMPALETLRMLSNFEAGGKPLFQSFLLGQWEFRETLAGRGAEQLRQRVIASCHLKPLRSHEETRGYVEHRLRKAGRSGAPLFTSEAYGAIHAFTSGVPRRINTFSDRVLLYGYLEGRRQIGRETVDAVAQEVRADFPLVRNGESGASGEQGADGEPASRLEKLERRIRVLEVALQGTQTVIHRALARRDA